MIALAGDSPWMAGCTEERRQASADGALLKRRCTPEHLAEVTVVLLGRWCTDAPTL